MTHVNQAISYVIGLKGDLHDDSDYVLDHMVDWAGEAVETEAMAFVGVQRPQRKTPEDAELDAVLRGLYALLALLDDQMNLPEDGAHLHALAAGVQRNQPDLIALIARAAPISSRVLGDAKDDSRALGHVLTGVNVVKETSFAGAALCAAVVAAPVAAGYGAVGAVTAGAAGGGLVEGGLRAVDRTDPRSLGERTTSGVVEGAAMAPAGAAGEAVDTAVRAGVRRVVGGSTAAETATRMVGGAAGGATTMAGYTTTTALAHGEGFRAATRAGLRAAEIGGPLGALADLAGPLIMGGTQQPRTRAFPALTSSGPMNGSSSTKRRMCLTPNSSTSFAPRTLKERAQPCRSTGSPSNTSPGCLRRA